jgi:Ca-activated chloride channel family protein
MTEDELKTLKDQAAPPPRAAAKAAALAAAMAAFDAAGAGLAKNSDAHAQGSEREPRLKHASKQKRRQKMRAPVLYKIAAGIAVILVATPTALYFVGEPTPFSGDGERFAARETVSRWEHIDGVPNQSGQARKDRPAPPADEKPIHDRLSAGQPDADADGAAPQVIAKQTTGKTLEQRIEHALREAKPEGNTAAARPAPEPEQQANQPAAPPPVKSAPAKPSLSVPATLSLGTDQRIAQERKEHRDKFEAPAANPIKQVAAEPVSTFSVDVDTASYTFVRRALNAGRLPPKDAVRVEEMINYFPYDYPRPEAAATPFQPTVTVTPAPWKPTNKLVHIAIKGYDIVPAERPRANLVFLIDVSGSMQPDDRLPLVKNAFRLMLDELKPDDTVGIVTYASGSGVALESTQVAEKGKILAAIDALGAGGSTAGAAGINDAYRLAEAHFDKNGVNRIILATDGDFNVGISNKDELKGFIERKRAGGIFLSVLGVGQGNYNDSLMQTLAQNGNGTAAYADTLNEARKVLVDEASSTLFTIAKDVKIQMEFNPAAVSEYRLIGYETRALAREDFNNDKVDAGDIGSGHTVTAIYEVTPVGAPKLVDDLRYGQPATPTVMPAGQGGELGFLKLRYKLPKEDASRLVSLPIGPALEKRDITDAPEDVRFSVAVAAFGQVLRGLPYLGGYGYEDVLALASNARGVDPFGYRSEFLNLVRLAKSARP